MADTKELNRDGQPQDSQQLRSKKAVGITKDSSTGEQASTEMPKIFLDHGIFHINYGFKARVTKESLEYSVKTYRHLHGEVRVPGVLYGDRIIYVDYDAARYASSPDVVKLLESLAIVALTPLEKLLGQMFLQLHKPPYPVKLFHDHATAISWSLSEKALVD